MVCAFRSFWKSTLDWAKRFSRAFKFGPHDAILLVSTSGIRPLIVDMAMGARERGMKVIGLVSRQHSDQSPATHPSGNKLVDLADVVIDNQCPPGDCAQVIDGLDWPTGPVSTLTGAMAVNMVRSATAEKACRTGCLPLWFFRATISRGSKNRKMLSRNVLRGISKSLRISIYGFLMWLMSALGGGIAMLEVLAGVDVGGTRMKVGIAARFRNVAGQRYHGIGEL